MATRPWRLEFLSFHLPSLIVEAQIGVYTRCCHLSGQKSGWIWRKFAGNCIKAPSHIRSMVCCFYSAKHVLDHSPKTDTKRHFFLPVWNINKPRARNCEQMVANATKTWVLVTSFRPCHQQATCLSLLNLFYFKRKSICQWQQCNWDKSS